MNDTDDLDRLFQAARSAASKPSSALMERVLADAYELQPAPALPLAQAARHKAPWRRWLLAMSGALGGSGALAGLGTAAVAGLFIGYASPDTLDWLSGSLLQSTSGDVELMSADDLFLGEG